MCILGRILKQLLRKTAHLAHWQLTGCVCVCAGSEAVEERDSDGEHRFAVEWRPRVGGQGRFGQDRAHQPRVYRNRREDCPESAYRETLEVNISVFCTVWFDFVAYCATTRLTCARYCLCACVYCTSALNDVLM